MLSTLATALYQEENELCPSWNQHWLILQDRLNQFLVSQSPEAWRSCECRGTWAFVSCSVQGWAQAAEWGRHEPHGFGGCSLVYFIAHWTLLRRIIFTKTLLPVAPPNFPFRPSPWPKVSMSLKLLCREFLLSWHVITQSLEKPKEIGGPQKAENMTGIGLELWWQWCCWKKYLIFWVVSEEALRHFHPHGGFLRSRFYSLSGPLSYSCYLRGLRVIGMEDFLDIYSFFHPVFSALFHPTGLNRHRVVASCPC